MAKPVQPLLELVRKGTFREDRKNHRQLLGDPGTPDLPFVVLADLQQRMRTSDNEFEARKIARAFRNAVELEHAAPADLANDGPRVKRERAELREELRKLGPPGSAKQAIAFFPRFLRWPDGRPFELNPSQKLFARDLYKRDRRRQRVFEEALLGVPRGQGKTPFCSGLSLLAECQGDDLPHAELGLEAKVFQVAGARHQAALGTEYASRWVEDGELGAWLRVKGSSIASRDGRDLFSVLSADGRLSHGRKFRRGTYDELWLATTYREVQNYVALETALQKDQEADLIAISTAGHDRSTKLGQLYDRGLACPDVRVSKDGCRIIASDPENGFLMHWYGAPSEADLEDPAIVRACNPGLHTDVEAILRQLRRSRNGQDEQGEDEYEKRRLLFNQWTAVKNPWLAPGAWRQLYAEGVEVPAGAEIYVAVDAAYTGDCTAVVYAWRDPDGRIHLRARVWSTSDRWLAHRYVNEPTLDNEQLVEPYIHELAGKFKVRQIVFDPEYFVTEAKHLANDGFEVVAMYPQAGDMSDAVRAMYRAVGEGKIGHDGDRVLTGHVESAQKKKVIRGTKEFTAIDKGPGGAKIDGATAAIMAHWAALGGDTGEFVGGLDWMREGEGDE